MLSYGENQESLSHLCLNRYRVVTPGRTDRQTDRQTDRITIANTRLAVGYLLSRVKTQYERVCNRNVLERFVVCFHALSRCAKLYHD